MSTEPEHRLSAGVVTIAVAPSFDAAVRLALAASPPVIIPPAYLLTSDRSAAVASAARATSAIFPTARSDIPRQDPYVLVELASGSVRFTHTTLPAWAGQSAVGLIAHAPARHHHLSPVQMLASLARRRQQFAARLTGDTAAAAELASAWPISLGLIVGSQRADRFAIVTTTLLATELVWWALRADDTDAIGAWEQSSVQRLTMLGGQPAAPTFIRIVPATISAGALARRLAPRLGV